MREADEERRAERALALHRRRICLHLPVRQVVGCPGASRAAASAGCPRPWSGCTLPLSMAKIGRPARIAGLVHVDMRIGLVAGDHRRMLAHRRDRGWCACRAPRRSAPRARSCAGARSSSPSPSSWLCVTIAPCRSSSIASQPRATASQMRAGDVLEGRVVDRPARRSAWRRPDHRLGALLLGELDEGADRRAGALERRAGRLALRAAARAAAPKRASGVGTGEKVLVSCFILAMTRRMKMLSREVAGKWRKPPLEARPPAPTG